MCIAMSILIEFHATPPPNDERRGRVFVSTLREREGRRDGKERRGGETVRKGGKGKK